MLRISNLVFVIFSIAMSGCSINMMYSENFEVLKQNIDYRAPTPLAQKLTYVYATGTIIDDKPNLLIASNVTNVNDLATRAIGGWSDITGLAVAASAKASTLTTAQLVGEQSSVTTASNDGRTEQLYEASDQLSEEARTASAAGDFGGARMLSDQAIVSAQMAQVNQSFNDSINMLNTYASTMSALAAAGKGFHADAGAYLARWMSTHAGAIGSGAPEGSILHMDFLHAIKAESFKLSSNGDLIVTAVLEYPDGRKFQAARGIKIVVDSKSDVVPLGFVSSKAIAYTKEQAREIDNGDFNIPLYLHQFAVLIRSTIKDLYQQSKE